jgi:hypothetical protein
LQSALQFSVFRLELRIPVLQRLNPVLHRQLLARRLQESAVRQLERLTNGQSDFLRLGKKIQKFK